jgi:hypothetical protein
MREFGELVDENVQLKGARGLMDCVVSACTTRATMSASARVVSIACSLR